MTEMVQFNINGISLEAQYLYRYALDMIDDGKTEVGLKYLRMAVSLAPRFCKAYNVIGNCLDEMGRYDEAIRSYEKALEIDPQHAEARFKRSMVRKKIGTGTGGQETGADYLSLARFCGI